MSLNPCSAAASCVSCAPDAKFSLNINAFNGNTTNFNRCPAPKSSALVMPIQPGVAPATATFTTHPVRTVRPM